MWPRMENKREPWEARSNTTWSFLIWVCPAWMESLVLRHLRLRRPSLPVLVLTLRSRVEDRVQCLDTGADDYLPKPFSFTELSARIRCCGAATCPRNPDR